MDHREHVFLMLYRTGEVMPLDGHRLFLVDSDTADRWLEGGLRPGEVASPGLDLKDLVLNRCAYRWDGEPLVHRYNRFDPFGPGIGPCDESQGISGEFMSYWPVGSGLESGGPCCLIVRSPTGEWRRVEHLTVARIPRSDIQFANGGPVAIAVRTGDHQYTAMLPSLLVQPNLNWQPADVARASLTHQKLDKDPDGTPVPPVGVVFEGYWRALADLRHRYRPSERRRCAFDAVYAVAAGTLIGAVGGWLSFREESLAIAAFVSIASLHFLAKARRSYFVDRWPARLGDDLCDGNIAVRSRIVRTAGVQSPPCIFVSYSTKDSDAVHEIATELEAAGMPCWYSGRDITPGTAGYHDRIMDAIRDAWLVVAVLSKDSRESPHVLNELEVATNRGKTIVPILVEEFSAQQLGNASYYVQRFQMLNMPLQDKQLVDHVRALAKDLKVSL